MVRSLEAFKLKVYCLFVFDKYKRLCIDFNSLNFVLEFPIRSLINLLKTKSDKYIKFLPRFTGMTYILELFNKYV